jgi:hypothetical protein
MSGVTDEVVPLQGSLEGVRFVSFGQVNSQAWIIRCTCTGLNASSWRRLAAEGSGGDLHADDGLHTQ